MSLGMVGFPSHDKRLLIYSITHRTSMLYDRQRGIMNVHPYTRREWGASATRDEENLRDLVFNLDQALTAYHGEFRKPAQQLLQI